MNSHVRRKHRVIDKLGFGCSHNSEGFCLKIKQFKICAFIPNEAFTRVFTDLNSLKSFFNLLLWMPSSKLNGKNFTKTRSISFKWLNFRIVAAVTSATFLSFLSVVTLTLTECSHGMIKNIALPKFCVLFGWRILNSTN